MCRHLSESMGFSLFSVLARMYFSSIQRITLLIENSILMSAIRKDILEKDFAEIAIARSLFVVAKEGSIDTFMTLNGFTSSLDHRRSLMAHNL